MLSSKESREQIEDAYEVVRLAELSSRGADEAAAQEGRKLDCARRTLELLIKNSPNHITQGASD